MAAAVEAYVRMLRLQEMGRDFVKSEIISELVEGPLKGRTRASVQYRFQNISAVINETGRVFVRGFVPAEHVGEPSRKLIRRLLADRGVEV